MGLGLIGLKVQGLRFRRFKAQGLGQNLFHGNLIAVNAFGYCSGT